MEEVFRRSLQHSDISYERKRCSSNSGRAYTCTKNTQSVNSHCETNTRNVLTGTAVLSTCTEAYYVCIIRIGDPGHTMSCTTYAREYIRNPSWTLFNYTETSSTTASFVGSRRFRIRIRSVK